MLNLQAYLSGRPGMAGSHVVGEPLEVKYTAVDYLPQVSFYVPGDKNDVAVIPVDAVPAGEGQFVAKLAQAERAGFYEAQLTKTSGNKRETRRFAVNVNTAEGDLAALDGTELAKRLQPQVKYKFAQAAAFELSAGDQAGFNLSQSILYFLVFLLICEQILAWSASYHPAAAGKAKTSGFGFQGGAS